MKKITILLALLIFYLSSDVFAQTSKDILTGTPALMLGSKTEDNYTATEITNNLNVITNQDFTATAGISGALMSMLQTPQEIYTDSKKVLFYLRLMPADTSTEVTLNPSGAIKIYLVNLQTQEEVSGDYFLKTNYQPEKSEVFILNRKKENGTPEIIYALTLDDFGFFDSLRGTYSLWLIYSNSSKMNNCWVGEIKSNRITIQIK